MVSDENADIAELQLPDDMLDVLHSDRVDTGKRLVEHDELWVDGQTARYLRTAALTTRQAVALVLADFLQAKLLDEALHLVDTLLAVKFRHFQDRHDIVLDAHLAEYARLLGQIADTYPRPLIDRELRYLGVVDEDVTVVGHDKAGGHIETRRLTGSVRTEKTHNLALTHIDAHTVDDGALAITLNKALGAQNTMLDTGSRVVSGRLALTGCDILKGMHHYIVFFAHNRFFVVQN